ncbi:MAG TPA: hypothetical protein PL110_10410 [Candidatus Eremiobacteraeota bacterium]|nr:MAG: hypothetical protein BWY64_02574 [bacterium ADurb.Bin363]HPZ08516.1 hypothetical protein [Candidatus Eremiobacteraeota bacterium]
MYNLKNQKGFSLLIMVFHFMLLIIVIEFIFLGLFSNILHRVTYEKRKETAKDLMNMAVIYGDKMEKYGPSPEDIFPGMKIDKIKEGRVFKRYTYRSPSLIKGGHFTIQYYYSEGKVFKVVYTGHFEGVTSCYVKK